MSKRYFMQKAHTYKGDYVAGFFASEKLDGMRILWDGGVTRGMPKSEVPFANHAKDSRYKVPPIATGLWSQLGNVVHAPDWFLDKLPNYVLGGELWKGYGYRQDLMSAVKKLIPIDSEWEGIKIYCYELPPPTVVFSPAKIKTPTCDIRFGHMDFDFVGSNVCPFQVEQYKIAKMFSDHELIVPHEQIRLNINNQVAKEQLSLLLDNILAKGGEGVVLRDPTSFWEPCRSYGIKKIKPRDDDEGIVTGYITGDMTDKGSKLLGKMGALILDYHGKRLELSGFTDEERVLISESRNAFEWACQNPKSECPSDIKAKHFPVGLVVSFKHRGFTKDGLPEEAHYWRKRLDD